MKKRALHKMIYADMIFMLWRKRQKDIIDWIYNEKKALLVTGARQIGKTYACVKSIVLINSR